MVIFTDFQRLKGKGEIKPGKTNKQQSQELKKTPNHYYLYYNGASKIQQSLEICIKNFINFIFPKLPRSDWW